MSVFDRFPSTVDPEERRRPAAGRLSERLVRTFGGFDRTREEMPEWDNTGELVFPPPASADTGVFWEPELSDFPPARNGYDRGAVDQRIDELEREIDELRISRKTEVAAELERIGEQTSAILVQAHQQAHKMIEEAREQADRCIQEAAANAIGMQARARTQVQALDDDTESLWQERMKLLEDARSLGTSLVTLADEAIARFPAEAKVQPTVAVDPVVGDPVAVDPVVGDPVVGDPVVGEPTE